MILTKKQLQYILEQVTTKGRPGVTAEMTRDLIETIDYANGRCAGIEYAYDLMSQDLAEANRTMRAVRDLINDKNVEPFHTFSV